MSRILVFGAGGLLGSHFCSLYKGQAIPVTHEECDITNPIRVYKTLEEHRPDVVINCAGIVPKAENSSAFHSFEVNSHAPHLLAEACDDLFIRMIQISTDCVFSGDVGNYPEYMIPQPKTTYGLSKCLGEVTRNPHMTVRCSFVGYPDPVGRGLLAWYIKEMEAGNRVNGWTNVLWNGLTTVELSRQLMSLVNASEVDNCFPCRLLHLHGERLSKYSLLKTAADVFGYDVDRIIPVEQPVNDKTLKSEESWLQSNKTFREMLIEMRDELCLSASLSR